MSTVTAVPLLPVKRRYLVWLWIGIVAAVFAGSALAWQGTRDPVADFFATNARAEGVVTTASGLQYKILTPGAGGPTPTDTDITLVNYEGKLLDGTTFDKSQQPTPFPVTGVVPGFSEGLKLMGKGAKYQFWIKPELAYGADEKKDPAGKVVIPANSVLQFEVELLDFLPESVVRQMQAGAAAGAQGAPGGPGGPPPGMPEGAMPQGMPQPR
jgi:hypothetical protein